MTCSCRCCGRNFVLRTNISYRPLAPFALENGGVASCCLRAAAASTTASRSVLWRRMRGRGQCDVEDWKAGPSRDVPRSSGTCSKGNAAAI